MNNNANCKIEYSNIRNKRQERINYQNIYKTNLDLDLSFENFTAENFKNNIQQIRDSLESAGIINQLGSYSGEHNLYHLTNASKYKYFIISVKLKNNKTVDLVIRSSDLYLQGFINEQDGQRHYYHFRANPNDQNPTLSVIEEIDINNTHDLRYDGNYDTLIPSGGDARIQNFNSFDIINSFETLSTTTQNQKDYNNLKKLLFYVILSTSESLRFNPVAHAIGNMLQNEDIISRNFQYFQGAINNWTTFMSVIQLPSEGRRNRNENLFNFVLSDSISGALNVTPTQPSGENILRDYYRRDFVTITNNINNANCRY